MNLRSSLDEQRVNQSKTRGDLGGKRRGTFSIRAVEAMKREKRDANKVETQKKRGRARKNEENQRNHKRS